ncbi:MAG: acyl-ACP--UDP-N-acetylglucosamine O-acyltransferase [Pseudomonadota bacterium]
MTTIHATAIVDSGAEIDPSAEIGPYCVIGPHVKIGAGCRIGPHAVVRGYTTLGTGVRVFQFASVGEDPQDLKFKGEAGRLEVGERTVIREGATLHVGTVDGGLLTRVGSGCLFMAYSHVAHDCIVGNNIIMANCSALAGHVTVEDNAIFSGHVGVHQFTRVGMHAMVSAGGVVTKDLAPFCVAQGDRAGVVGINVIGLRRHGFDAARIRAIKQAFRTLFREGRQLSDALVTLERDLAPSSADVAHMIAFARGTKRGLCSARHRHGSDDESVDA